MDEIDWLNLPRDARIATMQKLYKAVSAVAASTDQRIDDLMLAALPVPPGEHDRKNFGKGKMAAAKAKLIHKYLEETHFELAQTFAPSLFRTNPKSAWDQFLEAHAIVGGLRAERFGEMSVATRDEPDDAHVLKVRLGEKFSFELHLNTPATVVAFEEYQKAWYPLSLSEDRRRLRTRYDAGRYRLPRAADGTGIPLMEHDDTGLHRFVFVSCAVQGLPTTQAEIIKFARENEVIVRQTWTRIVS